MRRQRGRIQSAAGPHRRRRPPGQTPPHPFSFPGTKTCPPGGGPVCPGGYWAGGGWGGGEDGGGCGGSASAGAGVWRVLGAGCGPAGGEAADVGVAELPGRVAVDVVQQLVGFPLELEPLLVYLAALAVLVYQVQRAPGGDARGDVAGDVGVVASDQLRVRAHRDAEQWQQDQVDAQSQQRDHVRLAGQDAGYPLQDLVQARCRGVRREIVGRAHQPRFAGAVLRCRAAVCCHFVTSSERATSVWGCGWAVAPAADLAGLIAPPAAPYALPARCTSGGGTTSAVRPPQRRGRGP